MNAIPLGKTLTQSSLLENSTVFRALRAAWLGWLTSGGRWLLIAAGLFFGYGTTSLELQVYIPLLYLGVLCCVLLLTTLLERPRAALHVRHAPRTRVGQVVEIECEVTPRRRPFLENRFSQAHDWRILPLGLPAGLKAVDSNGAPVPAIEGGQSARVLIPLQADKRGAYQWPGWRIVTDFPFGICLASRSFKKPCELLVHPQWTPLSRLELPVGRRYQPGGVAMASARGESMEYIGNRDFRDGDNPRDMDWRATARLQKPIVREYREEYFLRAAVVLDTYAGDAPEREYFERAVSLTASICDYMAREDYLVDLFAAGPNIYHLTAGRSVAYLEQILDILACVETTSKEPFSDLEPEIESHLAQINTVLCVFLDWTQQRRDFVSRLQQSGTATRVLIARDTPCTIAPTEYSVQVVPRTAFENGMGEL